MNICIIQIWLSHMFTIYFPQKYWHHLDMILSKNLPCFSFVNTGIIVIIIRYWHHSNMILLHTYHLFPVKILPSFEYGSPTLLLCFLSKILALFEGGSVTKERKAGEYRLIQSPYFTYHIEICLSAAILDMSVFSTLRNNSHGK